MTSEIVYSHCPAAGISVAATNKGAYLIVAFSLTNDGTSRNGLFWQERRDTFSRVKARQILNGRLEAAALSPGEPVPLTVTFESPLAARKFIAELRLRFKPTPDETDTLFTGTSIFGTIEVRWRQNAEKIIELLYNMANEIVANTNVQV